MDGAGAWAGAGVGGWGWGGDWGREGDWSEPNRETWVANGMAHPGHQGHCASIVQMLVRETDRADIAVQTARRHLSQGTISPHN